MTVDPMEPDPTGPRASHPPSVDVIYDPPDEPRFAAIVSLHGEHDIATAADVSDAIAGVSGSVLVDLSTATSSTRSSSEPSSTTPAASRRAATSSNSSSLQAPSTSHGRSSSSTSKNFFRSTRAAPRATPTRPQRHSRPPCPSARPLASGNLDVHELGGTEIVTRQGFESSVSDTGRLTLVASLIAARLSETRPPSPSRTPSRGRGKCGAIML